MDFRSGPCMPSFASSAWTPPSASYQGTGVPQGAHPVVQAMGMLQQEFAAGSREIVRQLERGNRMEESKTSDRSSATGISREDTITMFIMKGVRAPPSNASAIFGRD